MTEIAITLLAGVSVGLALGLTGSGGSLFAIPLLLYVVGMDMASAVPVSLLVVGATALVGAVSALRRDLLLLRPTIVFGVAGAVSAPLGLKLGAITPENYRVLGFAVLALVMAARMGWQSFSAQSGRVVRAGLGLDGSAGVCRYSPEGKMRFTLPCAAALTVAGLVTGILSGFFGVGGGFLIVPALMYVIRMDMAYAVGSSLAIIAMIGLAGGALNGLTILMQSNPAAFFGAGSLLGMVGGRFLAARLAGPALQRIFAAALFGTGVFILAR